MYYNTNNESGEILEKSRQTTKKQDQRILDFFKKEAFGSLFAPHQIANKTGILITSVRRSLNTLTSKGVLVKTDVMTIGEHGKRVYTWRLGGTITLVGSGGQLRFD